MTASEDLIDQAYFLFIRPLGNLVVLCAQAEAALLAFVAELMRRDEPAAQAVLKKKDAQRTIIELVQQESNIQDFERSELVHGVEHYYSDCKRRNRYMHDEWYVSLLTNIGVPRTRGFPRKKDSQPVWDDPIVDTNSYSLTRPTCCDSVGPVTLRKLPASGASATPVASS